MSKPHRVKPNKIIFLSICGPHSDTFMTYQSKTQFTHSGHEQQWAIPMPVEWLCNNESVIYLILMGLQGSFWVWAQPMRWGITYATPSLIGWAHTQNDPFSHWLSPYPEWSLGYWERQFKSCFIRNGFTVYPIKYAHSFVVLCFVVII